MKITEILKERVDRLWITMKRRVRRLFGMPRTPQGQRGIDELGHRGYVGGLWEELGNLQLEFMIEQDLKPHHCLLDIECGSLRAGIRFISYLEKGNYLGLDREKILIDAGIREELGARTNEEKMPEFVITDSFEFAGFSKSPDFSIAQSLFSHLSSQDIGLCLTRLRKFVTPGHSLFATFFEGNSSGNARQSDSHLNFHYSQREMIAFGADSGWEGTHIGAWGHPRNQIMMRYVAN